MGACLGVPPAPLALCGHKCAMWRRASAFSSGKSGPCSRRSSPLPTWRRRAKCRSWSLDAKWQRSMPPCRAGGWAQRVSIEPRAVQPVRLGAVVVQRAFEEHHASERVLRGEPPALHQTLGSNRC